MKRFIGWLFIIAGGLGVAWGGICVLTGSSQSHMEFSPDVSIKALPGGLISLAVLTVGLIWVRD